MHSRPARPCGWEPLVSYTVTPGHARGNHRTRAAEPGVEKRCQSPEVLSSSVEVRCTV